MQVLIKENLLWQLTIVCVLNLLKCCRDEIVEMLRWLMCQWYFPCLWEREREREREREISKVISGFGLDWIDILSDMLDCCRCLDVELSVVATCSVVRF